MSCCDETEGICYSHYLSNAETNSELITKSLATMGAASRCSRLWQWRLATAATAAAESESEFAVYRGYYIILGKGVIDCFIYFIDDGFCFPRDIEQFDHFGYEFIFIE